MNDLDVLVVTPQGVLYEGKAETAIFPGEEGVFEVMKNHKAIFSRLIRGEIFINNRKFPIRRGVVKAGLNRILAIVEGAKD